MLGVAGSIVGTLGFRNATTGSIVLQPATGALGSSVLTLPATTGTLVTTAGGTLTGPVIINLNSTLPSAQTGALLQLNQANATINRIEMDTFAAPSILTGVRANGTAASPTTLIDGSEVISLNAWGYDAASRVGPYAAVRLYSAGTWTSTSHPTRVTIGVTLPAASATLTDIFRVDGGIAGGTAGGAGWVGVGDNLAHAISFWPGTKMPVLSIDRLVGWTGINDNSVSDMSVIAPVDSISNQYASFSSRIRTSTAFNINHLAGFEDLKTYAGVSPGVLSLDWSFLSNVIYSGTGNVAMRQANIVQDFVGTGSATEQRGYYCASLTKAGTNWCIYSDGTTPSFFGGSIFGSKAGAGSIAPFVATGAAPTFGWNYPSAAADQKNWDITANATSKLFRAVSDDNLSATNWMTVTRGTGTAVAGVAISPPLTVSRVTGNSTGVGSIAPFLTTGITPTYGWYLSTNGVDQKTWDITQNSTSLLFRAVNDANSAATNWMTVTRGSGTAVSGVAIPNLTVTGGFTATGLVTNASLANPATTVNGQTCTLGSTCTVTAAASGAAGGDLTGTYPNPTLAAIISAGGPTGSATVAPIITYDAKGRLTAVSSATITPAIGSITGLGTNVATALSIAIGSAGAPVTFNGAGGTPASIVLTNATGTASSLTAGTASAVAVGGITGLGTGVATALAINIGTAGSFVTNGGALGSPSSAGTLPAFTLGGTISGGGNQLNNIVIGTTTPLAGAFTTLNATAAITQQGTISAFGPAGTTNGNNYRLFMDGSSGTGGGAHTVIRKNFAAQWLVGSASSISASGTSDDYQIFSNSLGSVLSFNWTTGAASFGAGVAISNAAVDMTGLASDAATVDNTVCVSGAGRILKGSGALGVCLGTSSEKFKHDIVSMGVGLAEIVKLSPKNFFYNKGYGDDGARQQYGFIAEDVIKVLPGLTGLDKDKKPQSVDMLAMVPVLVKAVQELKIANDNLLAEVQILKTSAGIK